MLTTRALLLVLAGGALGSAARFLGSEAVQRLTGLSFPVGTLAVNTLGCFLMGFLMTWALERAAWPPEMRLLLTTGFLGGFTTLSTFSWETMRLLEDGAWLRAAGNVTATVLLGLFALGLGMACVRSLA